MRASTAILIAATKPTKRKIIASQLLQLQSIMKVFFLQTKIWMKLPLSKCAQCLFSVSGATGNNKTTVWWRLVRERKTRHWKSNFFSVWTAQPLPKLTVPREVEIGHRQVQELDRDKWLCSNSRAGKRKKRKGSNCLSIMVVCIGWCEFALLSKLWQNTDRGLCHQEWSGAQRTSIEYLTYRLSSLMVFFNVGCWRLSKRCPLFNFLLLLYVIVLFFRLFYWFFSQRQMKASHNYCFE